MMKYFGRRRLNGVSTSIAYGIVTKFPQLSASSSSYYDAPEVKTSSWLSLNTLPSPSPDVGADMIHCNRVFAHLQIQWYTFSAAIHLDRP